MAEQLYLLNSFALDEPIEYKGLKIFPVRVKDYINFFLAVEMLIMEKNRIPDPKVISMKYLEFLINVITTEKDKEKKRFYSTMFFQIFTLCCRISGKEDIMLNASNIEIRVNESNKIYLLIDGVEYTSKDFDEIKSIILKQNLVEEPDNRIDPKVKKALEEARELRNKGKKPMGSFEDQIICAMTEYKLTPEEIKKLTIRKFRKMLERADHKLHYKIYKSAEMSGFVKFKTDIDHWMSEIVKDEYGGLYVDYGEMKGKFSGQPVKE